MYRLGITFVVLVLVSITAIAQIDPVPGVFNYQGMLFQADGRTPETGSKNLEFRLYANKDDTDAVWGELHENVILIDGVFNVELGAGSAISGGPPHSELAAVFTQEAYWLGVTVQSEVERQARQQVVSAPYAFTANTAMTAAHGVPTGTVAAWAGSTVPIGWLRCDGTSYPRTGAYAALFAAIGTAWGDGDDPGNTFNVPNFGGRALMGETGTGGGQDANSSGMVPATAGLTSHTLGDLLGEETHVLTLAEMASHTHPYNDYHFSGHDTTGDTGSHVMDYYLEQEQQQTSTVGGVDTDLDGNPDAAAPHNTMQPSTVVPFIIKY